MSGFISAAVQQCSCGVLVVAGNDCPYCNEPPEDHPYPVTD